MRDIIIVDDLATVTPVSGGEPTISGETVLITLDRLIDDDFNFDDYLCSEDNLTFGKMESAHLEFTIINDKTIPYLQDMIIKVYEYTNGDSSTLRQIGRFTVLTDEKASDRLTRTINAYDDIYYLRDYDITEWYYQVYADSSYLTVQFLRNSLFTWLNESEGFSITQQSVTLINDSFMVYKGIESDVITFGFFMNRLIEFNGCFGHIGADGTFNYVSLPEYSVQAVKTLTPDDIIPPVEFEDYKVWGIGFVDVYDRNNSRLYRVGSSSMQHPSRYRIIDSFIFYNYGKNDSTVKEALQRLKEQIDVLRYVPFETDAVGDYSLSVGDRIDVRSSYTQFENGEGELVDFEFPTYILELHRQGIQQPFDTYSAKGNKKQPKYKLTQNSNWHVGDSTEGVGTVSPIDDEFKRKFLECIRNVGIRVPNQPLGVSLNYDAESCQVEITWTDPADIDTNEPIPVEWAGTIVVRSTQSDIWHRWDTSCVTLVDSTTRDEYSTEPFVDDDIEYDTQYYYGIFPYSIGMNDSDLPIKYYNPLKVISVNTLKPVTAPAIVEMSCVETDVTVKYSIVAGYTWDYIRLVGKPNAVPENSTDGVIVSLNSEETSVTVSSLQELTTYYFVIFAKESSTGKEVQSEVEDIMTRKQLGIFHSQIYISKSLVEDEFHEMVAYSKVTT